MSYTRKIAVAQSGGPTAAINASLCGVIDGALENGIEILGAENGILGIINEKLINLNEIFKDEEQRKLLCTTPSSYLGSCRYRLSDDEEIYEKIFGVFEKYDIGCFIYIGGNDSMDTVNKLSIYAKEHNKPVNVVGVPKTVDNDLACTDHCPGFGSAAKFVATAIKEVSRDSSVYAEKSVTIIEIMGRNAGWLTAAASLARSSTSTAPHLIYLPERPVSPEKIIEDVRSCEATHIIIAVSEGLKNEKGEYYSADNASAHDIFGHAQLAGCAGVIEKILKTEFNYKMRSIELNVPQRAGGHITSLTDLTEAREIGKAGAKCALYGNTGVVMGFVRTGDYEVKIEMHDVASAANAEKKLPDEYIADTNNNVTDEFIKYCRPLILGEPEIIMEDGLPKHVARKDNI